VGSFASAIGLTCDVRSWPIRSAKQVHFDLATKLQVDRAFTLLSGNLSPKALEALFDEQFVPTLGSMMTTMTTGHSCASAAVNIMANAAWMRSSGLEKPGATGGASTETSAEAPKAKTTPEKGGRRQERGWGGRVRLGHQA